MIFRNGFFARRVKRKQLVWRAVEKHTKFFEVEVIDGVHRIIYQAVRGVITEPVLNKILEGFLNSAFGTSVLEI